MAICSIDPATGRTLRSFDELTRDQCLQRLELSEHAFRRWRSSPLALRSGLLAQTARLLEANKSEYAGLMADEMGKLLEAGVAEVEKCAWLCRYYAEQGPGFLEPELVQTDGRRSYLRFDPLGPVLAVMPWNFPFWQVFRFAVPALLAGNVALLKHSSNVPCCALAIEAIMREAGAPEGVFQTLLVGSRQVAPLIEDERVRAVTLTGSEAAGSRVAEKAGRLLKKTVLELGGSDPFVVLEDADLEAAARTGVLARVVNSGQSCIAAKRFIVHRAVAEEFSTRLAAVMATLRVGAPRDPSSQVGPLARRDLLEKLHDQVLRSVSAGAKLLLGGTRLDRQGFYYAPTLLCDVPSDSPVTTEETFGPVAPILVAQDEQEALQLANDSSFGLGASLWTSDIERAEALAGELEAGMVFINGPVKSDPRLPFGGVKRSGYGRELGRYGMLEFMNIKSVWIA